MMLKHVAQIMNRTYRGFFSATKHFFNISNRDALYDRNSPKASLITRGITATIIVAATVSLSSAQLIDVQPTVVDFGVVSLGQESHPVTLQIKSLQSRGLLEVTSIRLSKNATSFQIDVPPGSGPWPVTPATPIQLQVRFSPDKIGSSTADLTISYRYNLDGNWQITVPLKGEASCEGGCTPISPVCTLYQNDESRLEFEVPGFHSRVAPVLTDLAIAHHDYAPYTRPVSFLWKIVGLDKVFAVPQLDCCDPEIRFTPRIEHPTYATFTRAAPSEMTVRSIAVPGMPTYEINLPAEIGGIAFIAGVYAEFLFDGATPAKPKQRRPYLKIMDGNRLLFEGDIACINSTFTQATVRRMFPGDKVPALNIRIKSED